MRFNDFFSAPGDSSRTEVDDELWVDRYRPTRFTDLCGDERVHRETMSWLKEWDQCVFGKRKNVKTKAVPRDEMNQVGPMLPSSLSYPC